jgi:hypothetical protein
MDVPETVLNSASAALFVLTKARCAEGIQVQKETRYKVLFSWPVHLEKEPEVVSYLKRQGIVPKKLGVAAYPVGYEKYESLRKVDTPILQELEWFRSYIIGCLIYHYFPLTGIEISAFWDQEENPETVAPTSTSDWNVINAFSEGKDAMFGFHSPKKKFNFKLPAKAGAELFRLNKSFQDIPVRQRDYLESSGKSTDSKGRANRFIVLPKELPNLEMVQKETIASLKKLKKTIGFKYLENSTNSG